MDLKSRSAALPSLPFSIYAERDLQNRWELQRFRREGLLTEDAVPVVVEFPGFRWGRAARIPAERG